MRAMASLPASLPRALCKLWSSERKASTRKATAPKTPVAASGARKRPRSTTATKTVAFKPKLSDFRRYVTNAREVDALPALREERQQSEVYAIDENAILLDRPPFDRPYLDTLDRRLNASGLKSLSTLPKRARDSFVAQRNRGVESEEQKVLSVSQPSDIHRAICR